MKEPIAPPIIMEDSVHQLSTTNFCDLAATTTRLMDSSDGSYPANMACFDRIDASINSINHRLTSILIKFNCILLGVDPVSSTDVDGTTQELELASADVDEMIKDGIVIENAFSHKAQVELTPETDEIGSSDSCSVLTIVQGDDPLDTKFDSVNYKFKALPNKFNLLMNTVSASIITSNHLLEGLISSTVTTASSTTKGSILSSTVQNMEADRDSDFPSALKIQAITKADIDEAHRSKSSALHSDSYHMPVVDVKGSPHMLTVIHDMRLATVVSHLLVYSHFIILDTTIKSAIISLVSTNSFSSHDKYAFDTSGAAKAEANGFPMIQRVVGCIKDTSHATILLSASSLTWVFDPGIHYDASMTDCILHPCEELSMFVAEIQGICLAVLLDSSHEDLVVTRQVRERINVNTFPWDPGG